jgi:hypothetical protein
LYIVLDIAIKRQSIYNYYRKIDGERAVREVMRLNLIFLSLNRSMF